MNAILDAKADLIVRRIDAYQAEEKTRKPRYMQIMKEDALEDSSVIVEVHVHDGPKGVGYTVYLEREEKGVRYRIAKGTGEHSQTHDWQATRGSPF